MPIKTLSLKAVIFDMDGVITNTMPDHHRAWAETFKAYGLDLSHFDVYSREGQPGDEALRELLDIREFQHTPALLKKFLQEKEDYFKQNVKQRFVVGSRRFIKRLAKQGFRLALVTGTSRHELHKILPLSIYNAFDVIITGCDVQKGKPHPEPFLKALDRLKISAKDAIVIENAPYGILSAKAAGLDVFALETSLDRSHLKEANAVFHSIKDLEEHTHFQLKL